jgi:hypothetical protein
MPDWPATSETQLARTYGLTYVAGDDSVPSTAGKIVTSAATTTAKGTPIEIIAAGALIYDAYGFLLSANYLSASSLCLLDIRFGAGAGTTVLSNLMIDQMVTRWGCEMFIPLPIPAGTRVSAVLQSTVASAVVGICIKPLSQGFMPSTWPQHVQTLGILGSAESTPTALAPQVSALTAGNMTKGNWLSLVPPLERPCSMVLLTIGHNHTPIISNPCRWLVDLAVDSSQIIYPDLFLGGNNNPQVLPHSFLGPLPMTIPEGSNISLRAQANLPASTNTQLTIAAYAFG